MNEEQTKLAKITPALQAAGWSERVDAESRILMEQIACQIAPGRIAKTKERNAKRVDYLLAHRGQKLAIVEAKSLSFNFPTPDELWQWTFPCFGLEWPV